MKTDKSNIGTRVLVTGAAGFSGRHIVKTLELEYNVTAHMGRKAHPRDSKAIWGDLSYKDDFIFLPLQNDIIIHTAGQSPDKDVTVKDFYYNNVVATANIIDYAKRAGTKKIIYFSTISVYGEVKGGMLYENSPIINPGVYGQSKRLCEAMLADCGIPTISLRLPSIVGLGCQRHWPSQVMKAAQENKPITIYNPAAGFNNAAHIDYICDLVKYLLTVNVPQIFDTLLVASSGSIAIRDLVAKLTQGKGRASESRDILKETFLVSTDHLNDVLPPWSIEETIDRYVEDCSV